MKFKTQTLKIELLRQKALFNMTSHSKTIFLGCCMSSKIYIKYEYDK